MGKDMFYEGFAEDFDLKMNMYDLNTRVDIVFEKLLPKDISGLRILDAGCGTGYFSQQACIKKANVVSMDVGTNLLQKVSEKCDSEKCVGSVLGLPYKNNSIDVIISSEVIEHTSDPFDALKEFYRVLKPGGYLALTVPNRFWKWSCILANLFRLRPYQGLENWVGYGALRKQLEFSGFKIDKYFGFHLFPFQLSLFHRLLRYFDRFGHVLGFLYINIATRCYK